MEKESKQRQSIGHNTSQYSGEKQRKSSILKIKHRSPLTSVDIEEQADTTIARQNRRVSFASSNSVKQFTADPEKVTIWDSTYEESVSETDDNFKPSTMIESTQVQNENRRTTIYFKDDDEDIEIDEEICDNLPLVLVAEKENLLSRNNKFEEFLGKKSSIEYTQRMGRTDDMKTRNLNEINFSINGSKTADMELTEIIPLRQEVVRPTILYRDLQEVTMMDTDMNGSQQMDFTECVQVVEKVEHTENVATSMIDFEETTCIGGIIKTTGDIFHETAAPESTSVRLDSTACLNENTQLLINYNISDSSKNKPHSEFSKILAGDYNPSPINSKILAICDLSSGHYVEQISDHVNELNVNDDSLVESVVNLSRKDTNCLNISQEILPMQISLSSDNISEEEANKIEIQNYCKNAMSQLIESRSRERKVYSEEITRFSSEMKSVNKEMKKMLLMMQSQVLKEKEKCKLYSTEFESVSLESTEGEIEVDTSSLSPFESTDEKEEFVSIRQKIEEKAKPNKLCWQVRIENETRCIVTTLNSSIISVLDFDEINGEIKNIDTTSHIKDHAKPIAKYILRQFLKKLSPECLTSSLGQHYDILSYLDYLHMNFFYFVHLLEEHDQLVKEYGFEMHEDMRVNFIMINKELMLIWDVEASFADDNLNEESIKVHARLGNVNERAVKKCVKECPPGFPSLTAFAGNIRDYMNSLKRSAKK